MRTPQANDADGKLACGVSRFTTVRPPMFTAGQLVATGGTVVVVTATPVIVTVTVAVADTLPS